jgi:protein O-GlcNAc transferase
MRFDAMSRIAASARATSPGEALATANRHLQAGDFRAAGNIFAHLWQSNPHAAQVAYGLAICENHLGLFDQAAAHFQAAIKLDPAQWPYHLAQGRNYKQQNKYPEAIGSYREALALAPEHIDTMVSLGIALWRGDQAEEAVEVFGRALQLFPGSFEAAVNCGNALLRLERHEEAVGMYRRALTLRPDSADVHNNLGKALLVLGRADEARECFEEALRILPAHPEALFNIGDMLFFSGNSAEAEKCYSRAVSARPRYAEAHMALGRARFDAGSFADALVCFDAMAEITPDSTAAQHWRGIVLREMRKTSEALRAFEQAATLARNPEDGFAQIGATYWQLGQTQKAEEFADRALHLDPANAAALNLKGNGALTAANNRLFAMSYGEGVDAAALRDAHRQWGLRQPSPPSPRRLARPVQAGRLRIGLVSADFISHSVAQFITPVLRHFDRDGFEFFCYSNNRKSDAVTGLLRETATGWRAIAGKNDQAAAVMIARDHIDVLMDLAGHTGENRLGVFAHAPAPMQVTYLGYPTTTGLPAMQYRLSDGIVDPAGFEQFSTETLLRMPHSYFCYQPPAQTPPVASLPAILRGHVTFGSFNNLAKMTLGTFRLWSRVLAAVANARLVLKNKSLNDASVRAEVCHRMEQTGIDPMRVDLLGYESNPMQHLMLYGDIDICVDTSPYNGATTTCEALWMGVPVVTLPGLTHASRMGASILSAAGLTEWIASDEESYIACCERLAKALPELARHRASLRPRLAASALMDHAGFTRDLEKLLRDQFESKCERC